jgi:localization factor PodJL
MARAYRQSDYADAALEPGAGDWQALRGELVALLDQVESRFGAPAPEPSNLNGLSSRVRHLRDQVNSPDPASLRREALRSVKRAVDRFSTPDDTDDLDAAIAQIRSRQGAVSMAALEQRPAERPEFRELSGLVSGISDRLGRLEGQLRGVRAGSDDVRDVANQVEQLTQVVELLAGAVGETGQVKRLEHQIAALAHTMEQGQRVDLSTVNARLDDVSATVAKLAELQAEQMEREIIREERAAAEPQKIKGLGKIEPVMQAIEENVRNVYDRIDAIERNMSISGGDFERLTSEMAEVTHAIRDAAASPELLASRVDALAASLQSAPANDDVLALRQDISSLRQSVMAGLEPRFLKLESKIEELSDRVTPVDTTLLEEQLKRLMGRMDDAGAQLDGLTRLYQDASERPDFEALANLVSERTTEAMARKAPPPVAMFGPESLKSIEDRISSLVRTVSKGADPESLAELVAERTSLAVAKVSTSPAPAFNPEGFADLEKRMTAVFNTAGKETAERLARLEATLSARQAAAEPASAGKAQAKTEVKAEAPRAEPTAEPTTSRLDSILSNLNARARADVMPASPADEAPLIDRGPVEPVLGATAPSARAASVQARAEAAPASGRPAFDPEKVERPPRPQSSFAEDKESFGAPRKEAAPAVEAPVSNTSTFVAAARRAQRIRQEQQVAEASSNSLISRAMARMRPKSEPEADPLQAAEPAAEDVPPVPSFAEDETAGPATSFLARNRRPLLLAAALAAVSLLTLNLVLQRSGTSSPATAAVVDSATPPVAIENIPVSPVPSKDVSELVAPRVIDMVDATSVASIGSGERMTFTLASEPPLPPKLLSGDEVITDAITVADTGEQFDLPTESVGPLKLREAAAGGDARAQFEVAAILTEGRMLPADPEGAAIWYERSAAQGFAPAQYRLGNLYETGSGVEKDLAIARLWYQRAAEAGNRMAMHNLAALYASGQLGDQEFEQAAEWFEQAAELGMTDSQFNLGMLYARGLGVEQDFERSYKWFSLAARSGDADAGKARDDIAKSLSADAVSSVNDQLAAWSRSKIDLAANFAPIGTWEAGFNPGDTITEKEVVSRVQHVLARLGYNIGSPDGVAGPKTAEAIRSFERGTGMGESGKINPRLLAVLGSQPV